jgi:hypothetical protein
MKTNAEIIDEVYERYASHYKEELGYGEFLLKFELSTSEVNNSVFKAIFCIAKATSSEEINAALGFLDECIADREKIDSSKMIKGYFESEGVWDRGKIIEKCEISLFYFILGNAGSGISLGNKKLLINKLHALGADFNLKPKYLEGMKMYPGLRYISNITPLELLTGYVVDPKSSVDDRKNFFELATLLIECGADKSRSGIDRKLKEGFEKTVGIEVYKAFHALVTAYYKDRILVYQLPNKSYQESYKAKIARRYSHKPYVEGEVVMEELGDLTDVVDAEALSVKKGKIKKANVNGVTYIAKPVQTIASEFGSTLFRMASNGMFTTRHDKIYRDEDGELWALSKFANDINGANFLEPAMRSKLAFDPIEANQDFMVAYARMMGVFLL